MPGDDAARLSLSPKSLVNLSEAYELIEGCIEFVVMRVCTVWSAQLQELYTLCKELE